MKTQLTTRVAFYALVTTGFVLTNIGTAVRAERQASQRMVTALNGWSGKTGPGVGSVKTPFNVVEAARQINGAAADTFDFHTTDGLPAQGEQLVFQGPGAWNVKAPGIR